jgi:hypothetical protein
VKVSILEKRLEDCAREIEKLDDQQERLDFLMNKAQEEYSKLLSRLEAQVYANKED